MTTSFQRAFRTVLVLAAVLLAIALAPGRAFAHEAIPNTTGEGTWGDPVLIVGGSEAERQNKAWNALVAALELKENLYIKVSGTVGTSTLDTPDETFVAGSALVTIPQGYAKDLELDEGARVHYAQRFRNGDGLPSYANGESVPFGSVIKNYGALTVHGPQSGTYAHLGGNSPHASYSVISNYGELNVYGCVEIDASFNGSNIYGYKFGRGIACEHEKSTLVVGDNGEAASSPRFVGESLNSDKTNDVAAGIFVRRAKTVDMFNGRLE